MATSTSVPITSLETTNILRTSDLFLISQGSGTDYNSKSISYTNLVSNLQRDLSASISVVTKDDYDELTANSDNSVYSTRSISLLKRQTDDNSAEIQRRLHCTRTDHQTVQSTVNFNSNISCGNTTTDNKSVVNVEYLNKTIGNTNIQVDNSILTQDHESRYFYNRSSYIVKHDCILFIISKKTANYNVFGIWVNGKNIAYFITSDGSQTLTIPIKKDTKLSFSTTEPVSLDFIELYH